MTRNNKGYERSVEQQVGRPEVADTQAEQEWIPAQTVLRIIAGTYHGRLAAKAELADLLRDGLLRARATTFWRSTDRYIRQAWKRLPDIPVQQNVVITPGIWRASKWWLEDQSQWRWTTGDFVITRSKDPYKRTMLKRVLFSASDVKKLQGKGSTNTERGPGGAPKRRDAWDRMWIELVQIAKDGRLTKGHLRTQKELRAELLEHLSEGTGEGLGEDSIKPVIQQVWHRFVEKPRPRKSRQVANQFLPTAGGVSTQ